MLNRIQELKAQSAILPKLLKSFNTDELTEFNSKYGSKIEAIKKEVDEILKANIEKFELKQKERDLEYEKRMRDIEKEQEERKVREEKFRKDIEESQKKVKISMEKMLQECSLSDDETKKLKKKIEECTTLDLLYNVTLDEIDFELLEPNHLGTMLTNQFLLLLSKEHSNDGIGKFAICLVKINNITNEDNESEEEKIVKEEVINNSFENSL